MIRKSQMARLLDLDWRIREGQYPNTSSFAEEYGVSSKTVQRDLDFMRDYLDAPLFYDAARNGYAYGDNQWFPPRLMVAVGGLEELNEHHALPGFMMEGIAETIERKEDGYIPYTEKPCSVLCGEAA